MSMTTPSITFNQVFHVPGSRREPSWLVKTHLGDLKIGFDPTIIQNETLALSQVRRFGVLEAAIDEKVPPGVGVFSTGQRLEVENIVAHHFGMTRHGDTFIPSATVPARLDADGTAKPKTRIVHHPNANDCQGPGMALKNPELEQEDGTRIPLRGPTKSDLAQCFEEIEKHDHKILKIGPGATWSLMDEAEPNGPVVLRDAAGVPRLMMPREVYEDLRVFVAIAKEGKPPVRKFGAMPPAGLAWQLGKTADTIRFVGNAVAWLASNPQDPRVNTLEAYLDQVKAGTIQVDGPWPDFLAKFQTEA